MKAQAQITISDLNDGRSIVATKIEYQASETGTTPPKGVWSETIPEVVEGQYLWTRTLITYSDDTNTSSYSVSKIGSTGTGIESIVAQFYVSKSKDELVGGTWIEDKPKYTANDFLWTRNKITYKDPMSVVYTAPFLLPSQTLVLGGSNLIRNAKTMVFNAYKLIGVTQYNGFSYEGGRLTVDPSLARYENGILVFERTVNATVTDGILNISKGVTV